jgi:hypothetical protein
MFPASMVRNVTMPTTAGPLTLGLALATAAPALAGAQDGVLVYRLGQDTVAIEQFSRTRTQLTGETVTRSGASVSRTQYEVTLGPSGRPTAAVIRRRQADGSPVPNAPVEYRFTFGADSATRRLVWPDSTSSRTFRVPHAVPATMALAYAPLELLGELRRGGAAVDSLPTIGLGGTGVGFVGLEEVSGDTLRLRGGPYPVRLRFDAGGRLLLVDGSFTANKSVGTRAEGAVNIAALARRMAPTGVLSPRTTAYAGFQRGPIFINYGSPAVRGRSVWGGVLVPYDSVWRVGANEATHLATSKPMQMGDMTLAPGLYTLWLQHTRGGTFLIVNRQVGQWGTAYDASQDLGRVRMALAPAPEHVEDLTITIRATGSAAGAIDVAWGDSVATAAFLVRP